MKQKQILLPSIITSVLLLIAIFPIKEYSYFIILRWVVCFTAIYVGFFLFQERRFSWVWMMGIIAVLFNPIEPIHLAKGIWQVIDFVTAIIFWMLLLIKKIKIPKDISWLHAKIISFGSDMQSKSSIKLEQESHIPNNVQAVFYKINAYGIILHRAIKTLCEDGWTHVTPCLLRTIMECSANCLAIIHNEYPEYMAFKYLYKEYVKISRDEKISESVKSKFQIDINQGIKNIADSTAKEKAKEFVANGNVNRFWFKPEENGVSNIIEDYGSESLRKIYGDLSMSVHAGHLGLFLFKDDPDDIEINPCENPRCTKLAISFSCRLLLELLLIRNSYENLGLDSEYDRLYERLMSLRNDS